MNKQMEERLKDFLKFLFALFFLLLILFLNLVFWCFIVALVKWVLEIFIPDIGWKIPIFSVFLYYLLSKITVRVVKQK